jgi:hypothetical protein
VRITSQHHHTRTRPLHLSCRYACWIRGRKYRPPSVKIRSEFAWHRHVCDAWQLIDQQAVGSGQCTPIVFIVERVDELDSVDSMCQLFKARALASVTDKYKLDNRPLLVGQSCCLYDIFEALLRPHVSRVYGYGHIGWPPEQCTRVTLRYDG